MKPQQKDAIMFPLKCYSTAVVSREIPLTIQFMAVHRRTAFSPDYLRVFQLSAEGGKLRIVHTQECLDYRKEYLLLSAVPITTKIYVINDETHVTMLFCETY